MKPEISLLSSEGPVTGPNFGADDSGTHFHTIFPNIHFNIVLSFSPSALFFKHILIWPLKAVIVLCYATAP
jgi:hypothetical protein